MINISVKRGDIVLIDFDSFSESANNGYCPAVVLQRNKYNKYFSTTIVAPIASANESADRETRVCIGKRFGFQERSIILLDQIQMIDQTSIDSCIGHINDDEIMRLINKGLRNVLAKRGNDFDDFRILKRSKTTEGIAERKERQKKKKKPAYSPRDIMCLCPVCRDAYRHRGFRVLNVGGPKDICDYCNYRTGVDYAVVGLLSR